MLRRERRGKGTRGNGLQVKRRTAAGRGREGNGKRTAGEKDCPREDKSERERWEKTRGISWGMSVGGESSKFPRIGFPDQRAASAAERWLLMVTLLKVGGISRVLTPLLSPPPSPYSCSSGFPLVFASRRENSGIPCRFNRMPVHPYSSSLNFSRDKNKRSTSDQPQFFLATFETFLPSHGELWKLTRVYTQARDIIGLSLWSFRRHREYDITENNNALSGGSRVMLLATWNGLFAAYLLAGKWHKSSFLHDRWFYRVRVDTAETTRKIWGMEPATC